MRILGSVLMALGTFLLLAAVLSIIGPELQSGGLDVGGWVTSFHVSVLLGVILLGAGALLRRRARRGMRVGPPTV